MDSNQSTANPADLNHLFGIKRPWLSPLYLSYPITGVRRLSADEAAQLCERDAPIKPTTREGWEISAFTISGVPHVALSKMMSRGGVRRAEATWHIPIGGEGVLRLSSPLGSGRRPTNEECRQLRSFGGMFANAKPTWVLKPIESFSNQVAIYQYKGVNRLHFGSLQTVTLFPCPPEPKTCHRPVLTASSQSILCLIF